MKSVVRNLMFDLGNVIVDIDIEGAYARLKALFRNDADEATIHKALLDYECGKISTELFINRLLSQCDHTVQAIDIIDAWNSMLIDVPAHRLDMLRQLRESYNVALLSNTNALHIEWVHRFVKSRYNVQDFEGTYFDQPFYSHIVGDRKPNASLFHYLVNEAMMIPELTLYMDDVQENLDVAGEFGFQTHLVVPGEEVGEYLRDIGVWR